MGDDGQDVDSPETEVAPEPESAADGDREWFAVRPTDDNALGTLWLRWTDGGTDMHLHRVCEIVPSVTRTDGFPYVEYVPEQGDRPTFPRVEKSAHGEYEVTDETVQFQFIHGLPRVLLRHVPLVVLLAIVVLVVGAEFTPGLAGVSTLVPGFAGPDAAMFALYLCITPILLWLFSTVNVVEYREVPGATVVYGLVAALASGVAVSLFLVFTVDHPSMVEPNVVFISGYLLLLLVAGQFLYEAALRTEHLFVKLGARKNDIVENETAYYHFLTDLHDSLHKSWGHLSPSRVFGVLLASQFAIIWLIGQGPQNLNYTPGLVINVLFNSVLGVATFQFLVVVRYFNRLLSPSQVYDEVGLCYEPFHVDGHGGFRDLGRFATRINIILSFAGLYLVYRLYVTGARGVPAEGLLAFENPLLLTVWLLSFVGPVVGYVLGAGAWGYYSFWSMHAKMVRDKHRIARQYQGTTRDVDGSRTPAAGDGIDHFDNSNGPAWAALQTAPTWPLDVNKMASLISGNALPLLLPVSDLLL